MSKLFAIKMLLLGALMASCGVLRDQYDIVHKNIGTEELDKVSVSYDGFRSGCGVLPPSISKTHSFVGEKVSIPKEAKVEWVTVRDGKKHSKMVKVREVLPKGRFRGDIIFLFKNGDVSVDWELD